MARRRGTAVSALPSRTARAIESVFSICVWMFSTSTVASSTRMPTASARPPSVIRFKVCPLSHRSTTAPEQSKGDVEHHDDHAAPVAQEHQHHQPGEDRPQGALTGHARHGVRDVGGLVELEAQANLFGQHCLHPRHRLFHPVNHGQGGGVRPLADHHVDGSPAVDEGEAGANVGAVLDAARGGHHVAKINVSAGPQRDLAQFLGIDDHGVARHNRHDAVDDGVAGRADGVAGGQGRHHGVRRQRVGAQSLRIDVDDDRCADCPRKAAGLTPLADSPALAERGCTPPPGSRRWSWSCSRVRCSRRARCPCRSAPRMGPRSPAA